MTLIGSDVSDGSRAVLRVPVPNTFDHLRIILQGRSTAAEYWDVSGGIQINDDAGVRYTWQQCRANGVGPLQLSAGGATSERRTGVGTFPAALAEAGSSAVAQILIPNYNNDAFYKHIVSLVGEHWGEVEGSDAVMVYSGIRRDIEPVKVVSAVLDVGLWAPRSQMMVYGF